MKIAISMKSNFAFERLYVTLGKKSYSPDIEIHKENVVDLKTLDDVIEFWEPDYLVLDSKINEFQTMEGLLRQHHVETIPFDSDFDKVIETINELMGEEVEVEEQSDRQPIKYVTEDVPEKIVYKDRIVEKEVIRTSFTSIPNKLVVVASMWGGAGSTTFSTNLARAIANRGLKVSYIEFPLAKPYMFDYLLIPQKEEEKHMRYTDIMQEIKSKGVVRNKDNIWSEKGIDWFVTDTRKEPIQSFTYEEMLKLTYSVNSTITIVDISSNLHNPDIQQFLHHADEIFVCVEPDIIKIDWLSEIRNGGKRTPLQRKEKLVIDFLNQIEETEGIKYQFINMKYTQMIDNKTWLQCLEKKPLVFFPAYDYETLIECVWKSKFLYDDETDELEKALKPAIVSILPREFYKIKKSVSKKEKFGKIIGRLKKGGNE